MSTQSTQSTPEDISRWHQYVAIECNNAAWQMTIGDQSTLDRRAMLNAAHASVYHWLHVGTDLNKMRGYALLAHVHAYCGHGATALAYIDEVYDYFKLHETEAWEHAFTHMIRAQAAHAAADSALHRLAYDAAQEIVDSMPEGEDKEIVMMTWVNIPKPS
jgi:hypothetical protein